MRIKRETRRGEPQAADVPAWMQSSRRRFCAELATASAMGMFTSAGTSVWAQNSCGVHFSVAEFDHARILRIADEALTSTPHTLVDVAALGKRNPQEFYSEHRGQQAGKDGVPQGFTGHADSLVSMNRALSGLTAAWRATGDTRYFQGALRQARAWFLDHPTRMLPTLEQAGAVPGIEDDRNNGVTETVALAECARAASFLCASPLMPEQDAAGLRQWFTELLSWFVDSKKGGIARQAKSLEAICWTMQAAEFARFTRNDPQYRVCSHLFRDSLLRQMNFDGYFAPALYDTDPYATSMFTLECLAAACESLSTPFESLWMASLPDGRGMHSAVAWALPYLRDRRKWPYVSDQENFKAQPVRQNALLFAGRAYDQADYIDVWKSLPPDTQIPAITRKHPITQPALWATRPPA